MTAIKRRNVNVIKQQQLTKHRFIAAALQPDAFWCWLNEKMSNKFWLWISCRQNIDKQFHTSTNSSKK